MEKKKAHVAQYKKDVVEKLVKLFKEYPIVGALNVESLPAMQFQNMRAKLRDQVIITMTKRRLIKIAIDKIKDEKKGIEDIVPYLRGMPALMFTKENPFKIYNVIKKNKSSAPAKAGQIAPKDIVVTAGPTPFAPGPVIGELGAVGIKTAVEDGKIAIKSDSVVVKEGEEIKPNVASILSRLSIKPMEIGLDITGIYEDGAIYERKILDIDEDEYINNVIQAHTWSFNLAIEAGIFNKETTEFLIIKAANESKALAREADIITDENVGEILGKAERQMMGLKSELNIPDAPAEKPAEEKKEEKAEEKKEEAPAEKPAEDKKEEKKESPEEEKKSEDKKEDQDQKEQAEKPEETKEEPKEEKKPKGDGEESKPEGK
ncbi:50S ribosomal protein L10 [Thermoproteota archaeon]